MRCRSSVKFVAHSKRSLACGSFEIAGTLAVSALSEKLQVDLLFLDGAIAANAMDVFSLNPLLIPVRSKVCSVFRSLRTAISGRPKCIQMDDGG